MKKYIVKVIKDFNDYQGKPISSETTCIYRKKGDVFETTKSRYQYLEENKVVVLNGIVDKK